MLGLIIMPEFKSKSDSQFDTLLNSLTTVITSLQGSEQINPSNATPSHYQQINNPEFWTQLRDDIAKLILAKIQLVELLDVRIQQATTLLNRVEEDLATYCLLRKGVTKTAPN
jgi:hypothetical protein